MLQLCFMAADFSEGPKGDRSGLGGLRSLQQDLLSAFNISASWVIHAGSDWSRFHAERVLNRDVTSSGIKYSSTIIVIASPFCYVS
jgi:hypothetical protein